MICGLAIEVILILAILKCYGILCMVVFISQGFLSTMVLYLLDYMTHYGLERKKLENGEYEPFSEKHSWNSDTILQNLALFNVQRHSDHHLHWHKPYQILASLENSPKFLDV